MNTPAYDCDTIVASATPPGRGGVSVLRISGERVSCIAKTILGALPKPRYATHSAFKDNKGDVVDSGLALYFPAPYSFTGEDVLELHGHGGATVQDMLLNVILHLGARQAKPGEFSQRAFLNNKIDLTQAEAIADLIDAGSKEAARSALRTLQGRFSEQVNHILSELTTLRTYVEAAIDFVEEDINFLSNHSQLERVEHVCRAIQSVLQTAQQGAALKEGLTLAIVGAPNAGKSSLLNHLSGEETAIVTPIAGTTRDIISAHLTIQGVPIRVLDTAGLRESHDVVEQEGIRRAKHAMEQADCIVFVVDLATDSEKNLSDRVREQINQYVPESVQKTLSVVGNKIDLVKKVHWPKTVDAWPLICVSAKTGLGMDALYRYLMERAGYQSHEGSIFMARRRHVRALEQTLDHVREAKHQWVEQQAFELAAEELRLAQDALGTITGVFRPDDLLGKIFSEFCVGK